ncbi:MAG: peptidoglycan editing factor PgeF [Holosporales bacterium]|nr:peptidoglycan editing factor PgeF [Holosporales bacterium]
MEYKTSSLFPSSGLVHGFFGRRGGVSLTPYDSLNVSLAVGDVAAQVEENKKKILCACELETSTLATVHQVHGTRVCVVASQEEASRLASEEADALITEVPGIALGMMTADCAPVLLYDPQAQRIAAVHAGWKGAFLGVVEETVRVLQKQGSAPQALYAVIGPCIQQVSYKVSEAFRRLFLEKEPCWDTFFSGQDSLSLFFNLPGFLHHRLLQLGVTQIEVFREDTYAHPDFFSFRRAREETQGVCGRQLSLIALKG